MSVVRIPCLDCVISAGDFLLAQKAVVNLHLSAYIVQEVLLPHHVRVLWWLTCEEAEELSFQELPTPVHVDTFRNVVKCRIKEVFEDCSSVVVINIYAIRNLAFVFHAVTLEKKLVNCAGMTRVFFTQYCLLGNHRLEAVDCHVHSPFSSTYVESYPSQMWYFLLEVKHAVEKMLNDPKQYQLC
jgi:hypothetical protein